jgi:DNA segregation ATPase FtsK/SpoIIIE-like protein
MNLTVFLALLSAVAVIFILKHVVSYLMVRHAGRQALAEVGKRALTKLPESVRLSLVESPAWTNAELIRQQADPLLRCGFQDAGVYSVDRMPGVYLRILCEPQAGVVAYVYDHPHAGSWTELVTRYTDGSTNCVTTMAPTGMRHPEWFRKIHADKVIATNRIYERFLPMRQQQGIAPVATADVVSDFERTYRKLALWRQEAGISPQEVAYVAVKWVKEKQANAIEQY